MTQDPKSIAGKYACPAERAELLVIGAGPAGIAAAIEGAIGGAKVVLADENPVAGALVGLDVPLLFGGRMAGAAGSKERFTEAVAESLPELEEAYDRGVDVRLGTYAWGAFVNGPGVASLPGNVVGIADEVSSSVIGFDKLVVAAGARDLCMFFPGAHLPGIVGANGLAAMLCKYRAFNGRHVLILGSGALARATAELAREQGIAVVGMVEVRETAQAKTAQAGTGTTPVFAGPVFTGHVLLRAEGDEGGVRAAVLAPVGGGDEIRIECDTICLAIGLVPNIELLDVLGARLKIIPERGGFVPEGAPPATSLADVFVAGDAAGLGPIDDPGFAAASGRAAARAALGLGLGLGLAAAPVAYPAGADCHEYQRDWMRALVASGGLEVMACLCEEVTRADLLGVQPPRYLGERPPAMAARDLGTLLGDGKVNQDQVKRLTRAGMGACQGRRCREQVALLLAFGSNEDVGAIPLPSWRAPVRPLPLSVLAAGDETRAMRKHWDAWFGIAKQWTPYADIGTEREEWVADFGLGETDER